MRPLRLTAVALILTGMPLFAQQPDSQTFLDSGDAKAAKGNYPGAIVDYTQSIAVRGDNPIAYNQRSLAQIGNRDLNAALADANNAIKLYPQYAEAYRTRGLVQASRSAYDAAVADYTLALKFDSQDVASYDARAIAKAAGGDFPGALADYSRALTLRPNDALAYEGRGLVKAAQKDFDGAVADYDQAISIDPKYASAYYARAQARQALRDNQGAALDLQTIASWMPRETKPTGEYVQNYIPALPHPAPFSFTLGFGSGLPVIGSIGVDSFYIDILGRLTTLFLILTVLSIVPRRHPYRLVGSVCALVVVTLREWPLFRKISSRFLSAIRVQTTK